MTNTVLDVPDTSESTQPLPGETAMVQLFKKTYTDELTDDDIAHARELITATPELKEKNIAFLKIAAGRESATLDYRDNKDKLDANRGINNAYTWFGKVNAERIKLLQQLDYPQEQIDEYIDELIYRNSWGGTTSVRDFDLFVSELGLDKSKYEATVSDHLLTRALRKEDAFLRTSTQDLEAARKALGNNYNKVLLKSLDDYIKIQMQTDLQPEEIGKLMAELKSTGAKLGLSGEELTEATKLLFMWQNKIGSEYIRYTAKKRSETESDFRRN